MKSKLLQRTKFLGSTLILAALLACNPVQQSKAQQPGSPAASAAPATGAVTYVAQPIGSKMRIEGGSNIHDWSMESLVVGGAIDADAGFPESALTDPKAAKATVHAFTPVRSFKSNSKVMDERMQTTMKEPQFKRIEYKLTELKPKSPAGATGPLQFDATGELTIAGKTQTITMPVTIEKKDGKLKVTGSVALKMTEFGVEPPSLTIAGIGLKTYDPVKITFEWVLAPKA